MAFVKHLYLWVRDSAVHFVGSGHVKGQQLAPFPSDRCFHLANNILALRVPTITATGTFNTARLKSTHRTLWNTGQVQKPAASRREVRAWAQVHCVWQTWSQVAKLESKQDKEACPQVWHLAKWPPAIRAPPPSIHFSPVRRCWQHGAQRVTTQIKSDDECKVHSDLEETILSVITIFTLMAIMCEMACWSERTQHDQGTAGVRCCSLQTGQSKKFKI